LSRPGKKVHPLDSFEAKLSPADRSRRDFLVSCCGGAAAALLPPSISAFTSPVSSPVVAADEVAPSGEFHFHPHYRERSSLDAKLIKVRAGFDDFVSEKYHDQIAAILAEWSASLLHSPQDVQALERVFAPGFLGSSLKPIESRRVRASAMLEVWQNRFAPETLLGREAFLQEVRSALSSFTEVVTAEFQITSIGAGSVASLTTQVPNRLQTRLRYEFVGTARDFYREQRVGYWDLEWEAASTGAFRIRSWRMLDETRSRSASQVYLDIAAQAFGGNKSFSAQILHGVDYWRTILDGACGIDVYGHCGISVADIDDDGFDDVYVCQPAGLPNRLYRNRGDGTFEDITEASGLGILDNTACALFADFNNSGRQDVVVVRASGPELFVNEGRGKFRSKPNAFQFANPPQGTFTGAAVADYDRDGWLDIYFCLYVYYRGADQYKYPSPYFDAENGPPNFMMRNNRDGTFRDVTEESGLNQNNTRYSFCCGWSDYNLDGWPDLCVVNDFGRKNLYRNNGDGTFSDVAAQSGVEDIGAGMSVCWLDSDNDGAEDFYIANMWTAAGERIAMQDVFQKSASTEVRALYRKHAMGNSLFHNDGSGKGVFRETSSPAGVEMGRWSWSSDAWDFDHDGFPDLYITNGMLTGTSREDLNSFFWRQVVACSPENTKPSQEYEQGWNAINDLIRSDGTWSGFERNVFYANNRDGSFSDVSGAVGLDFIEDGRAFGLADFDHDGRQEVFLKNRNAPQLRLLRNVVQDLPPSISFRLRGTKSNRDAVGAVITIETEVGRQTRTLHVGSGFLSQHSKEIFFGLGEAKGSVRASIRWPSGAVQELPDLLPNHRISVEEGSVGCKQEGFREPASRGRSGVSPQEFGEVIPTSVETWLLSPLSAPDFSLPDLAGENRNLNALRGRPIFLSLWAEQSSTSREVLDTIKRAYGRWTAQGLHVLSVNVDGGDHVDGLRSLARERQFPFPVLVGSDDFAGIYNILYRYMFDRHRDLSLPTSFLIGAGGEIVKIYQGSFRPEQVEEDMRRIPRSAAERLAKALPFSGVSEAFEFERNNLSYGSVFFQRGYLEQAETFFRLALHDDPSSAEALYGVGSVHLKQGKLDTARESFGRVVKLHAAYPDTVPNAWNNLGLVATREGHTEDAIPYFQEALKLSPDHVIALDNLGNAYRQLKRWEEARKTLERAVAVAPQDPEANYSLGMVFAQLDDSDRAYDYLQRALRVRPDYPEALNNLGVLYLRTRRRNEAVATFEECIRVAPTFDQSYLNLARVYALEGEPEKARTVLLDLLKKHPDHVQAKQALGQLQ
jgi:tetratricopeptide (TPR) repeat protein